MKKTFFLFLGIIVLGGGLINVLFLASQTLPPPKDAGHFEELTETQNALIKTQESLSKWLIGLAYTSLIGILGLRFVKEPSQVHVQGKLPVVACACMALSLFGGFLFYQATLIVLSKGPIDLLYGEILQLPLLVQFVFLLLGLIILAYQFFGKNQVKVGKNGENQEKGNRGKKMESKPITFILGIIGMIFLSFSHHLYSASKVTKDNMTSVINNCIKEWEKGRAITLSKVAVDQTQTLIRLVVEKNYLELFPAQICEITESTLDEFRFKVYNEEGDATELIEKLLINTNHEIENPTFDLGNFAKRIIRNGRFWVTKSGLIKIISKIDTVVILMNGNEVGVTNWSRRVELGRYTFDFIKDGLYLNEYNQDIFIEKDGDFREIVLEKK